MNTAVILIYIALQSISVWNDFCLISPSRGDSRGILDVYTTCWIQTVRMLYKSFIEPTFLYITFPRCQFISSSSYWSYSIKAITILLCTTVVIVNYEFAYIVLGTYIYILTSNIFQLETLIISHFHNNGMFRKKKRCVTAFVILLLLIRVTLSIKPNVCDYCV